MPDCRPCRVGIRWTLALSALSCFSDCASAVAHEGPPFPILVDQKIPGYLVSVWADPDIGKGEFYVVLEPAEDRSPAADQTGSSLQVEVWVQPVSKRLEKVSYPAKQQPMRNRIQFLAEPHFDQQEMWSVGIVIRPSSGPPSELATEVEATPPGAGPWDVLIYLFPFAFFGGLWALAFLRRRQTHVSAAGR